jgi:acetylxylan esterase
MSISSIYSNPYYSQCQPGTASTTVSTTVSTTSKSTTTVSTGPSSTSSTAPAGPTPPQGYSQITANVGSNPNNVGLYVYKPKVLANPPPLIVAAHYCTGTAQAYYSSTKYAQLAETHGTLLFAIIWNDPDVGSLGYYVIYPSAPRSGGCWDVNTNATLTHNGGSDSLGIVNAVRYAIANWGVDKTRVFATGSSSGAMMTSVLMGAYPDVFKAGAVDSGVGYACFEGDNAWNSQCSGGQLILTGQQWVSWSRRRVTWPLDDLLTG